MSMSDLIARRIAVTVSVFALVGMLPTQAMAQGCFDHVTTRNYTPWNCTATPDIDRVFRMQTITWNGHDYLFVDEGNEIKVFNIDNPQNPVSGPGSFFNIPNVGDSDYDMVSFSVCDDCRYGIANFKAATVLFDLGTGSAPWFGSFSQNDQATQVRGGFTFEHGGQQYLVAASLGSSPCSDNNSGLYQFNGINESGNPLLHCLDDGSGGLQVANGLALESTNPPVFYISDDSDRFNIYLFNTSTMQLDHIGNGGVVRANMERGYGAAVDVAAGLLATAAFGDLKIWDIGYNSGSPLAPQLLSTKDLSALPTANAVALRFPIVHVSKQYLAEPPLTFDISTPTNPVPLDQDFWDPDEPPNNLGVCMWNNHTTFSDDGSAMYLSRYSALQVIDPTDCSGSVQPLANLSMNPQPAFPGDQLIVNNTSVGGERFATWITDGPSAHGDTVLAPVSGVIPPLSTTNNPRTYTLPIDMLVSDQFWAHAAVESDGFPYVPGSTPDQLKSVQASIDRSPTAVITVTPQAAITGDTVTLTAVAEGTPQNPGGGSPFAWTVTDPSGTPTNYEGSPVTGVSLSESGQWTFDLDVYYEHDRAGQPGVPYTYSAQLINNISSVAADFTISPSSPVHDETITLNSTSRAQVGASLDFNWDVLSPIGTLVHELAFCDGPGTVNDTCSIPSETLSPGTYDFRLTLTNTGNSDEDVALTEDVTIFDGSISIDFTWAPTSPTIGAFVGFNITGVSAQEIEKAVWTFGGTGCDGTISYTCVEPSFPSCDVAAFAYASGGPKTVILTATTTGGVQQPQVQHTLTVQSSGSCGGSCTYSLSPTSRSFPFAGGSGSFTVSTPSGCPWGVFESASWISITSGQSGTGPGSVGYQVSANTGPARSADIEVQGRTHTVNQEAISPLVFEDDFESGDTSAWSSTRP